MDKKQSLTLVDLALYILAVPVLGILLGGIYSLPSMRITKERDPWLTILLAVCLQITIFGIGGAVFHAIPSALCAVSLISLILLLLAKKVWGNLGHSLERFGMIHALTLLMTFGAVVFTRNH